MNVRIVAALVLASLWGAGGVAAQEQSPQERINAALARARGAGIPVALLESKIAEGKAKGVSLDRVAAAIERRQANLERASQALRGQPDVSATLAVAADALESGVNEAVLRAAADEAPRERRSVAIAALTELVHQGHAPESALARVRDALKRGPDALANLPAEAAAGRRGGGPPTDREGRGNARGRSGGGDSSPPAAVPAPGKPPQAGRPEGSGNDAGGNQGQGQGQGQGRGRGEDNRPANPGRGGQ